jgi:hypothetical protein
LNHSILIEKDIVHSQIHNCFHFRHRSSPLWWHWKSFWQWTPAQILSNNCESTQRWWKNNINCFCDAWIPQIHYVLKSFQNHCC